MLRQKNSRRAWINPNSHAKKHHLPTASIMMRSRNVIPLNKLIKKEWRDLNHAISLIFVLPFLYH